MTSTDQLRNSIIEKFLAIRNKEYLAALYELINNSKVEEEVIHFTEAQIEMLKMAEEDIKAGRVTDHEELYKKKMKWLEGK